MHVGQGTVYLPFMPYRPAITISWNDSMCTALSSLTSPFILGSLLKPCQPFHACQCTSLFQLAAPAVSYVGSSPEQAVAFGCLHLMDSIQRPIPWQDAGVAQPLQLLPDQCVIMFKTLPATHPP